MHKFVWFLLSGLRVIAQTGLKIENCQIFCLTAFRRYIGQPKRTLDYLLSYIRYRILLMTTCRTDDWLEPNRMPVLDRGWPLTWYTSSLPSTCRLNYVVRLKVFRQCFEINLQPSSEIEHSLINPYFISRNKTYPQLSRRPIQKKVRRKLLELD